MKSVFHYAGAVALTGQFASRNSQLPFGLADVSCAGNELRLGDCPATYGDIDSLQCEVASVVCQGAYKQLFSRDISMYTLSVSFFYVGRCYYAFC